MDVRDELLLEASYEPFVKNLITRVNTRLNHLPVVGELWVRLRPPTEQELAEDLKHPALTRFYRMGSLIEIVEVLTDFVEVYCSGRTLMIGMKEFLNSYVMLSDWPGKKFSSVPPPGT